MSKAALCMYIKFSAKTNSSFLLTKCPKVSLLDLVFQELYLLALANTADMPFCIPTQECVSSGLSQWLTEFSLIKSFAFSSSCTLVVKSPCGFIAHFPRPKTHLPVFSSPALLLLQGNTSWLTSQTTALHMLVLETVTLLCSLIPGLSLLKSWGIPSRKFTSCASRAT